MGGNMFHQMNIEDYMINIRNEMVGEIKRLSDDEILRGDIESMAADFAAKHQVKPPVLEEEFECSPPSLTPGNAPVTVRVEIPFDGESNLFACYGHHAPVIFERVEVLHNRLALNQEIDKNRLGDLKGIIQALVGRINEALNGMEKIVKYYNEDIVKWGTKTIQERRDDLAKHGRVIEDLEKLGFRLKRRNDGNEKLIIPVKPRTIAVQPPAKSASAEPDLSLADYDQILEVIQSMVKVFERSPSVFKSMKEEDLRTILLVALNGVFKGNATGETFNGIGDTDILIRVNDTNIFMAECLIWSGPEHFRKKLTDQLFNYATWRDTKLAAIVFNRNKDFSSVVQKMSETAAALANKVTSLPYSFSTGCRHRLRREKDTQQQLVLTCLAFDVPS